MLVGYGAAPGQGAGHVFEPPFFSEQRGDPGLSTDTASQRLQTQPPELGRLVPALFPAGADLQRPGGGAGVQGAAQETERGAEKPSLAGFARAWEETQSSFTNFYLWCTRPLHFTSNRKQRMAQRLAANFI